VIPVNCRGLYYLRRSDTIFETKKTGQKKSQIIER